jgi:SHS2 domain-containing protein
LSHTADVKIKVYGKNLKEIINNSLLALKSFWKPKLTKTKIEKEIKIESNNEVNLLIDFLSEILAETYIEKAIFIKFISDLSKAYPNDNRIEYPNNRPNENEIFGQNSDNTFGQDSGSKNKFGPNSGNDPVYSLSGKIIGYEFTSLSKDIKAITYHQANLQKINHQYIFEFIIDI